MIIVAGFLIGAFAFEVVASRYRIGLDLQDRTCLPWTVYLIQKDAPLKIARGDIAGFFPKGKMGPTFEGRLVIKQIAGLPGDTVTVSRDQFYINGQHIGPLDLMTRLGKPAGYFDRVEIIPDRHYLFIGTEPRSFDGRYWGYVPLTDIVADVTPIW